VPVFVTHSAVHLAVPLFGLCSGFRARRLCLGMRWLRAEWELSGTIGWRRHRLCGSRYEAVVRGAGVCGGSVSRRRLRPLATSHQPLSTRRAEQVPWRCKHLTSWLCVWVRACSVGDGSAASRAADQAAAAGEGPPLIEQIDDNFLRDALVDNRNRLTGVYSTRTRLPLLRCVSGAALRQLVASLNMAVTVSRSTQQRVLARPLTRTSPGGKAERLTHPVCRRAVLKVELEIEKFLKSVPEQLAFTMQLTSYQRAAIHRVAGFYGMQSDKVSTDDDPLGPGHIVLKKTPRTRAPLVRAPLSLYTQPTLHSITSSTSTRIKCERVSGAALRQLVVSQSTAVTGSRSTQQRMLTSPGREAE
jgi:hypothetical protein